MGTLWVCSNTFVSREGALQLLEQAKALAARVADITKNKREACMELSIGTVSGRRITKTNQQLKSGVNGMIFYKEHQCSPETYQFGFTACYILYVH